MVDRPATRQPTSILLVDDNDDARRATADILEQAGYGVAQAADGAVGLSLIDLKVPDLVITDIFMPDGDGFEMLNEIRNRALSIPVIVISGGGTLAKGRYLSFASHLGATSVLEKPLKPRALLEAVAQALSSKTDLDTTASNVEP
jgi:DNA-binding NtrC family response regulator